MDKLVILKTEKSNEKSRNIDRLDTIGILSLINQEDSVVPIAVSKEIEHIAKAVDLINPRMQEGGRLIYIGSGSSGRMGVLDAAECPPTYGTDPSDVVGIIAGGKEAMFVAQEGAEDDFEQGKLDLAHYNLTAKDSVVGIAASGRTPYVLGALDYAREVGALTIGLSGVADSPVSNAADIAITPECGPEVVTGSTRMKNGTAQKLVLNMLTTSLMIKQGKVFGNLMVDLKATNIKLVERSNRVLMTVTGINREEAEILLAEADGHVKTAIVMYWFRCKAAEAREKLSRVNGQLNLLKAEMEN